MSFYDQYDQTGEEVIGDDEIMADVRRALSPVRRGAVQAVPPRLVARATPPTKLLVPAGLGTFSYDDMSSDLTFKVEVEPQIPFIVERLIASFVTDDDAITAVISDISVAGQPMTPVTGEEMPWEMFAANATLAHAAFTAASGSRKLLILGRVTDTPAMGKTATISFGAYGRMLKGAD